MHVISTIAEFRAVRRSLGDLAVVPTMGALHAGHISLVEIAARHARSIAVSIFVNPTQFGPTEDFTRYPRPIERDLQLCQDAGVHVVFSPSVEEMYPPGGAQVKVDVPQLANVLEGQHRPGHFVGVCQVVAKLLNITQPDVACFGRKDYQQLRVIQGMVRGLDMPVRVIPCPTVREPDGLAMSSRNVYLSADERHWALSINQGLLKARDAVASGFADTQTLVSLVRSTIEKSTLAVDYVSAVDAVTLQPARQVAGPTLLAVAAKVGTTRLIDNMVLGAPDDWQPA